MRKCQQLCDIDNHDHCLICQSISYFTTKNPTRYDFEANKKNNLIFYGLPSDPRETPNSLVTKVEHRIFADFWTFLWLGLVCRFKQSDDKGRENDDLLITYFRCWQCFGPTLACGETSHWLVPFTNFPFLSSVIKWSFGRIFFLTPMKVFMKYR